MKIGLLTSAAFIAFIATPAMADIVQVSPSSIQGFNVLFNSGITTGTTVDGFMNDPANSRVLFTGAGGAVLRAQGGQARISADLNLGTKKPNDLLPLDGFSFRLEDNSTFNNVEFNLFGGTATSANFTLVDDAGTSFNFSGALGNGENRFGFQAIAGQSIRSVAFLTVGGGIQDVRQIRLGATTTIIDTPDTPNAIPEPATWAMMVGGFGMLGFAARRRVKPTVTYA